MLLEECAVLIDLSSFCLTNNLILCRNELRGVFSGRYFMKRAFWILIVGVLSNAEGMNAVDLDSVLSEAQTVFRSICYSEYKLVDGSNESSKPHSVKFSEQRGVEIDLSKHEDRHRLKLIREDDPSRPIDFTVRLTADSQVWRVTAGCRRKSDSGWTLSNPDGLFPYPRGIFEALYLRMQVGDKFFQ